MNVQLTPDQAPCLAKLTHWTGGGIEDFVQESCETDAPCERGEFVENEEVRGRIERMFRRDACLLVDWPRTVMDESGRFPIRGRIGREAGTRAVVVGPLPYVIVYKVTDDAVHEARILHAARPRPES
jgi:hypothetical protein